MLTQNSDENDSLIADIFTHLTISENELCSIFFFKTAT